MCLILFSYQPGIRSTDSGRLIIAANRDEAFRRPTDPAGFWADAPRVFAGRDRNHGGTWLGVTRQGRFAALTNYREPGMHDPAAPSRGALVSDFLRTEIAAADYCRLIATRNGQWNGFNLLAYDGRELWYVSNRGSHAQPVAPGVHGLSNHLLDTAWPKVLEGRDRLVRALTASDQAGTVRATLFELLDDRTIAADAQLPATGLPIERERLLSAAHILPVQPDDPMSGYGTRCATVVLIDSDTLDVTERAFDAHGKVLAQSRACWPIAS